MPQVVTINRPDVIALVERAAARMTHGNKTEAVALALRQLLERSSRTGSLFGAHPGSVRVQEGVDLVTAGVEDEIEAETATEHPH